MAGKNAQAKRRETIVDRDPDAQAEGFAIVRLAHESETAEDPVELLETRGEARPVDINERFG